MRIIAGKYRRRKLHSNPGETTRPITDRAKEMIFENLGGELQGERVADIFSGTGTIGLEALSRGAKSVVFFEKDRDAHQLLMKNVATLEAENQTLCWKSDVMRSSFRPKGEQAEKLFPYDLIFFDPPYVMVKEIKTASPLYKSLERLGRDDVSSEDVLLIFRTPEDAVFEMPPMWEPGNQYSITRMKFHLFTKKRYKKMTHPDQTTSEQKKNATHPEE